MSDSMTGGCGCGSGGCGGGGGGTSQNKDKEAAYLAAVEKLPIAEFVLASLLTAELSQEMSEHIDAIVEAIASKEDAKDSASALGKVLLLTKKWVAADRLKALSAEYLELFARLARKTPIHESEYGSTDEAAKKNILADLTDFYRPFSEEMSLPEGQRDLVDHVAVELEFYSLLLTEEAWAKVEGDNEGLEIILGTKANFLRDHLAPFLKAIAESPEVTLSEFYGPVFSWCLDMVTRETQQLGLSPIAKLEAPNRKKHESGSASCCGSCT